MEDDEDGDDMDDVKTDEEDGEKKDDEGAKLFVSGDLKGGGGDIKGI